HHHASTPLGSRRVGGERCRGTHGRGCQPPGPSHQSPGPTHIYCKFSRSPRLLPLGSWLPSSQWNNHLSWVLFARPPFAEPTWIATLQSRASLRRSSPAYWPPSR
ncbi:unnamed protein product, partial [Ectocarpus sp. 6 AP-2014]